MQLHIRSEAKIAGTNDGIHLKLSFRWKVLYGLVVVPTAREKYNYYGEDRVTH
jgi:hypothetical protein